MTQPTDGEAETGHGTTQPRARSSPSFDPTEIETAREIFSSATHATQYAARAAIELGGSSPALARHELNQCRTELSRALHLIERLLAGEQRGS